MRKLWLLSSALLLAAVTYRELRGVPPSQAIPADTSTTLLLWFGLKAATAETWDGSITVTNGRLLSIEGRHFSTGDEAAEGKWKAKTRRDEVAPYADVNYTEIRPGSKPEIRFYPVGIYLKIDGTPNSRIKVETQQGAFDVGLDDLKAEPFFVLNGRASVVRLTTPEKLTSNEFEDDEPSISALTDGGLAVAWVAYKAQSDRVFMRIRRNNSWSEIQEVSERSGDIFKTSIASTSDGTLWVFWSERDNDRWFLWGRSMRNGTWSKSERISGEGSATFHRAAASPDGTVFVVWQCHRNGQSDIVIRAWKEGTWSPETRLSSSTANDWEPAIAAGPNGVAHIAWDSYDRGNYDVHYARFQQGKTEFSVMTENPRFQTHVSVAMDTQGRPWLAWNESGVNWGKDQGFLLPTSLATPLHQERSIKVVYREGTRWMEVLPQLETSLPTSMQRNSEHPTLAFTSQNGLTMIFRHWTRRVSRSIGSQLVWENFVTQFDGKRWSTPKPLPASGSWIEKLPAIAADSQGDLWAAWMTDNRSFADMIPRNADIFAGKLDRPSPVSASGRDFVEPFVEAIPIHTNDAEDVKAIREYSIDSGGKKYRVVRGDMHRHTDISQDFKYDGSLFEVYRYALDAAGFDYIAPTDHQTGYDQEYSWWQNQKYVDLFLMPGHFTPLFAYERSLRFPNGHRNIVWAKRGVRTLPIPPDEASGAAGAKKLFEHLKATGGISMPHSSATDQGTDWRDNDPEVEPLVEIYQGYRASYEYEGAPKAATALNQHAQKSGWQPAGFYWNALSKGYKLGVQASSDHWSTHISYACLLVEGTTREHLMDAIRKRHAYAATDNIILDFRIRADGKEYLQGDAGSTSGPPQLSVRVQGTNTIKQIDVIKDKTFLYTTRPAAKSANFTFTDARKGPAESWYYVRILQEDGQIAWSSPIWLK